MFDAGDHVKFGFPMAFTATVLSWAILEYGHQMDAVSELAAARNSLKWITDYLINAHPSENVLYVQVGDPKMDHKCWDRPEAMTEKRPLIEVNISFPGTEVVAETVAAMASSSLVFKRVDPAYSKTLLKHAHQLFSFADKYRGSYSVSIPQVQEYYNSSGYEDELLWAASWLYYATEDESFLQYVINEMGKVYSEWGWFSWDNKLAGTQVLLSRLIFPGGKFKNNDLQKYRKHAENFMCGLLTDCPARTSNRTYSGRLWVSQRNTLQYSVASGFFTALYSDYMITAHLPELSCCRQPYYPSQIRSFAQSQADFVLGLNSMDMIFLVGYGKKYPQYVHHRGASIPANATTGCADGFTWLDSTDPNPNVAVGGLVGGPFLNGTYIDSRRNSMQGEPRTYYSALIVGLLSSLLTNSTSVQSFT